MSIEAAARRCSATGPRFSRLIRIAALCLGTTLAGSFLAQPALALSEIKREELPAPGQTTPPDDGSGTAVPSPDETTPPTGVQPDDTNPLAPGEAVEPGDEAVPDDLDTTSPNDTADPDEQNAQEPVDANEPIPEVIYDVNLLPPSVRTLREQVLEACKSGDIQKLRPLIGQGDEQTQLSLAGIDGDPIDYLKSLAGDEDGQEILAILEEVLSAGYVHLDVGTPEELYVWPYFFAMPIDKLTGPQRVELFKIVTAGDYEEMKTYGSYIFYRVGITPQGKWAFFVAGE